MWFSQGEGERGEEGTGGLGGRGWGGRRAKAPATKLKESGRRVSRRKKSGGVDKGDIFGIRVVISGRWGFWGLGGLGYLGSLVGVDHMQFCVGYFVKSIYFFKIKKLLQEIHNVNFT